MTEQIRFLSEYRGLRMVRKPVGEQIMPNGTVAITTPETVYEFDQGALTLHEGQDVMPDGWNEDTGLYELPQDAISWIRTTPEYGDKVIEVAPVAPDPGSLFVEVGRLEAAGDIDGLMAVGDTEAASWNRDVVLDQVRDAIERLSEPVEAK